MGLLIWAKFLTFCCHLAGLGGTCRRRCLCLSWKQNVQFTESISGKRAPGGAHCPPCTGWKFPRSVH